MYPNCSDDELIYLIRRASIRARELLLNRYNAFISRWIKEFNEIPFSEFSHYMNLCIIKLLELIDCFDERKGIFYTLVKLSIDRLITNTLRKEKCTQKMVDFCLDDSYFNESKYVLKEDNEPIPLSLNDDKNKSLEEKVLSYRIDKYTYKQIGALLDISTKKVDNILTKLRVKQKRKENENNL